MADFAMVTARLATGAAVSSAGDVAALQAAGITHVLDLRAEFDDGPLLAGSGLAYLWNPTADDSTDPNRPPKPAAWWQATLTFAVACYGTLGTSLYCHCAAGVNRGPSAAYAVARACWGLDGPRARAMILAARPQALIGFAGDFDTWWAGRPWAAG